MASEQNDKRIRAYFHSRYDGGSLEGTHLDRANKVFLEFFEFVEPENAEICIFLDLDESKLQTAIDFFPTTEQRFLIVREPRQVHPRSHSRWISNLFANIFFLGGNTSLHGAAHPWPYTTEQIIPIVPPARENRDAEAVVAVAAWRVSFIQGELYSLRARAFSELDVETFGRGWKASFTQKAKEILAQLFMAIVSNSRLSFSFFGTAFAKPKQFRGEVIDKLQLLRSRRICLVIENSSDYMSEKVLDALTSGAIPVYCGADLSQSGIPSRLLVQCEPNIRSLEQGIALAKSWDYDAWHSELLVWLASEEAEKCLDETLHWRSLCEEIANRVSTRRKREPSERA